MVDVIVGFVGKIGHQLVSFLTYVLCFIKLHIKLKEIYTGNLTKHEQCNE